MDGQMNLKKRVKFNCKMLTYLECLKTAGMTDVLTAPSSS